MRQSMRKFMRKFVSLLLIQTMLCNKPGKVRAINSARNIVPGWDG